MNWQGWYSQKLITADVREAVQSGRADTMPIFLSMSRDSVYRRFLAYEQTRPHEDMQKLVELDDNESGAVVACPTTNPGTIAGMGRFDVDPSTRELQAKACAIEPLFENDKEEPA